MALYARIVDGIVTEVFTHHENPHALFDPEWEWIEAPEGTVANATWDGETFTNPPAPEPLPEPEPETPSPVLVNIPVPHFKMRFTPQERVAIKTAGAGDGAMAPYIADWLSILDDPRLEYVTLGDPNLASAMGMLVQAQILSPERAVAMLSTA